jgi:hypothetical protein
MVSGLYIVWSIWWSCVIGSCGMVTLRHYGPLYRLLFLSSPSSSAAATVAACMCGLLVVCGFSSLTAEFNRLVVLYYNWIWHGSRLKYFMAVTGSHSNAPSKTHRYIVTVLLCIHSVDLKMKHYHPPLHVFPLATVKTTNFFASCRHLSLAHTQGRAHTLAHAHTHTHTHPHTHTPIQVDKIVEFSRTKYVGVVAFCIGSEGLKNLRKWRMHAVR